MPYDYCFEMPKNDSLTRLAELVAAGLTKESADPKAALESLFGDRFEKRQLGSVQIRNAFALAGDGDKGIPWAGLIHPDNPTSGPYGGTSFVWFPGREGGALASLVVGTRGLSPDEGILTRPGHRRRVAALRRFLSRKGFAAWTKPDPSALGLKIPLPVARSFQEFQNALERYGDVLYTIAEVPRDVERAREVIQAFVDLYAFERGWRPMAAIRQEHEDFLAGLRADLFPQPTIETVEGLLRDRRFVIVQGPPGTGKTRMADEIWKGPFGGHGMIVQFHPAVTYEDFVIGLSPDVKSGTLRFDVRPGWLLQAGEKAREGPFLLIIDEINRGDLGKILGEAIFLFEPGDVGGAKSRKVCLPHKVDGSSEFAIPEGLYVLGTMNTADRSIASLDIAIRRRFSFVTLPPDRDVVARQGLDLATRLFDDLTDVFVEHAPDDALDLIPGHSYFLASDERELRLRLRHDLLPLLDDYIRQGVLGAALTELSAVRDRIADIAEHPGG